MKISDGFLLKTVAGKNIVVSVGAEVNFNGMLTLNDTGVFLWNLLKSHTTKEEMLKKMLEEYDVEENIASTDIDNFLEKLRDAKILED
ncbi:MAG: PqqD family protein [Clostridia bacterium]|nr:PqqD family protein [Clostridia bacterium]